jgi:phage/plasmid-like protein (TIGR03299 family)
MVELTKKTGSISKRWLGMGNPIDADNIQDALEQGGLDWTVSKRPIVTISQIPSDQKRGQNPNLLTENGIPKMNEFRKAVKTLLADPADSEYQETVKNLLKETEKPYLPHQFEYSIVRDDINVPFGVMGNIYECIENKDCLSILDPLIQEGKVKIERIGYFNDGAYCWAIAKLEDVLKINGEVFTTFMKLSWSHDGSEKLSANFIAYYEKNNIQISPKIPGTMVSIEIRHTTNAHARIDIAKSLLRKGEIYFQKLKQVLTDLISMPFSQEEMDEYLLSLFPENDKEKKNKNSQAENKREKIKDLFMGFTGKSQNTKFAGLMAVAQWADNQKSIRVSERTIKNGEKEEAQKVARMQSIWLKSGSARQFKDKAFTALLK